MHSLSRLAISSLLILSLMGSAVAQDHTSNASQSSEMIITASASGELIRFTAPQYVVQIRLEVYNPAGGKVLDNEVRGGNILDWHLRDGRVEPLPAVTYLCVITVKNLSGTLNQRIGALAVQKSAVSMQAFDPSQLTVQQLQSIGPVEDNASLTILKEDEKQTTTLLAHNGEDGLITRGSGALSFRIGDFFSGRDQEQMRLSAEGNLGIGITHPQVRLDVDGLIRATQGIVFPDGSIQYSAATRTFGPRSSLPDSPLPGPRSASKSSGKQEHPEAITQSYVPKFIDGSGTLGNSLLYDDGSGIGIGTTSPQTGFDYHNPQAPFFTRDLPTNPGNAVAGLQLGLSNVGARNAGVGPSFLFFGENSAGAKSFLGRVSGVWENPTAGAEAGAIFFQVRANSGDVNALTERMRITSAGKVGIGISNPAQMLTVRDGLVLDQGDTNNGAVNPGLNLGGGGEGIASQRTGGANQYGIDFYTNFSNRMSITSDGNVGIGTTGPLAKLHARASGALFGVFGESDDNAGVHGFSSTGHGVSGFSTAGSGVSGSSSSNYGVSGTTASTGFNVAGVYGEATANSGTVVGVYGKATNDPNGTGMAGFGNAVGGYFQASGDGLVGVSTSGDGFGGAFRNSGGGMAIKAEGNVMQDRGAGGFVKAMAYVDPFAPGGIQITRCYNSQATGTAVSTAPCGFTITHSSLGFQYVDFGFDVRDRFILITPVYSGGGPTIAELGTIGFPVAGNVEVATYYLSSGDPTDVKFFIFVY